jgi:hypothetical protein
LVPTDAIRNIFEFVPNFIPPFRPRKWPILLKKCQKYSVFCNISPPRCTVVRKTVFWSMKIGGQEVMIHLSRNLAIFGTDYQFFFGVFLTFSYSNEISFIVYHWHLQKRSKNNHKIKIKWPKSEILWIRTTWPIFIASPIYCKNRISTRFLAFCRTKVQL